MTATAADMEVHGSGWKIKQRYSPQVLIGNWYEDRALRDPSYYYATYQNDRSKRNRDGQPTTVISRTTTTDNRGSQTVREERRTMPIPEPLRAPGQDSPNNYGLKQSLQRRWAYGGMGGIGDRRYTTYTVDYEGWPRMARKLPYMQSGAYTARFADDDQIDDLSPRRDLSGNVKMVPYHRCERGPDCTGCTESSSGFDTFPPLPRNVVGL